MLFNPCQITSARISKDGGGGGGGEKGKILSHEDVWSMSDVLANVPLLGFCYRWLQAKAGAISSNIILRRFSTQAGTQALRDDSLNTHTLHAVYHPLEAERHGKKHQLAESGSGAGTGKKGKGEAKEL